jgi:hypothetical protein
VAIVSQISSAQGVKVAAKVFLSHVNPSTLLMDNYLTILPSFPLTDPYKSPSFINNFNAVNDPTLATIPSTALSITGSGAVVDWVFVELRQGVSGNTSVVATRAGVLLKNGIIVDVDVLSPLQFSNTPPGNYFITIRHRNHLGFRTNNAVALSSTATLLDFSNNSVALYGVSPLNTVNTSLSAMNGGDANADGSVDSSDAAIWEYQNGSFDDYWLSADCNLDGSIDGVDAAIIESNNGKYEELN